VQIPLGHYIAYKRKRLGLFGRIRLVADLAALVRQSDARQVIQATSRLDRLQKWALRHESAATLEARHLLRAVARRVVRLRVWSGS
jgi:predicted RNA-binding protein with PIN domain